MYVLINVFMMLNAAGSMNISGGSVYPDQQTCEAAEVRVNAYLQGKYEDSKEVKYFNSWCIKLNPVNAQAN